MLTAIQAVELKYEACLAFVCGAWRSFLRPKVIATDWGLTSCDRRTLRRGQNPLVFHSVRMSVFVSPHTAAAATQLHAARFLILPLPPSPQSSLFTLIMTDQPLRDQCRGRARKNKRISLQLRCADSLEGTGRDGRIGMAVPAAGRGWSFVPEAEIRKRRSIGRAVAAASGRGVERRLSLVAGSLARSRVSRRE